MKTEITITRDENETLLNLIAKAIADTKTRLKLHESIHEETLTREECKSLLDLIERRDDGRRIVAEDIADENEIVVLQKLRQAISE